MDADNQQERLKDGFHHYIAGFVDGEGTFHVAIQKTKNVKVGYQLIPDSNKNIDFIKFSKIVKAMQKGVHLNYSGLINLLHIVFSMNRAGKYRTIHKSSLIRLLESSETIRQTSIQTSEKI